MRQVKRRKQKKITTREDAENERLEPRGTISGDIINYIANFSDINVGLRYVGRTSSSKLQHPYYWYINI
jgi:hypothetical protein